MKVGDEGWSISESAKSSGTPNKTDPSAATVSNKFSLSSSESYIIINVSDYSGANDSERIQKALDDVPEEGAIVFIPKGIWIASNLVAKSKTIILGENGTVIERPVGISSPFIIFQNRSDFAVVSIEFDGRNVYGASGIRIVDGTRFKVTNNTFKDISINAIRVSGISTYFEIESNDFFHCDEAPVILFGSPGTRWVQNFSVARNSIINGTDNGKIGVAFSANGKISNNTLLDCQYGIATRCVSNISILNNRITDCIDYAIYLGTQPGDPGSDNIDIKHNYIANCNIGIARYYGSYPILNVILENNTILHSDQWDVHADFPATFIQNVITSIEKLKILTAEVEFIGNKDIEGQPVLPGDTNNDLRINMKDIGLVARLFGTTYPSENWNPLADIIEDDIINMKDVSYVARRFGFQYS